LIVTVPPFVLDAVQPWADLYANSPRLAIGITFLHLGAMMVGGGVAIATDWRVLFGNAETLMHTGAWARTHGVVVPAFVVIAVTGLAMALADLELFSASAVFGTKILLALLLAANGSLLVISGRAGSGHAQWQQRTAAVSLLLWFATLLAGCWLQVAA
jgi:hypothetical protein